jgi:hypothetical protein
MLGVEEFSFFICVISLVYDNISSRKHAIITILLMGFLGVSMCRNAISNSCKIDYFRITCNLFFTNNPTIDAAYS